MIKLAGWKTDHLKVYLLLIIRDIPASHVSLPEARFFSVKGGSANG